VRKLTAVELLDRMLAGVGHQPVLPRVVWPEHRFALVRYVQHLSRER
jgi:hypothetical protein